MTIDLLKKYIADDNRKRSDCFKLMDTLDLDKDEKKFYSDKIAKAKPPEETKLTPEQFQEQCRKDLGFFNSKLRYLSKMVGPKGEKTLEISIQNLNCNIEVMTDMVCPGLARSVIHNATMLSDHKTKLEPKHELDIRAKVEELANFKVQKKEISEAIKSLASKNECNPIEEWILGLKNNPEYEGILHNWLPRCLGTDNIPVINKIGYRWAIQAVARARKPGRCNESVLGLCAEEGGEGKSRFIQTLAYDKALVYEGSPNLGNTQSSAQTLIGSWFVDFTEGDAMDRHSQETNKRFITQGNDKYTEKYENCNTIVDRPYVFMMTTNNETPLYSVELANVRRWQFVKVKKFDAHLMLQIRGQLFYEANQELERLDALRVEGDKDPYVLMDEDKDELVEYSKQFVKTSVLEHQLRDRFKDSIDVEPYYKVGQMLEIARVFEPKCSRHSVWNILKSFGFTKEKKSISFEINGITQTEQAWVYIPPKSNNATKIRVDEKTDFQKKSSKEQIQIIDGIRPQFLSNVEAEDLQPHLNADQAAVINILGPNSKDVKSNIETFNKVYSDMESAASQIEVNWNDKESADDKKKGNLTFYAR